MWMTKLMLMTAVLSEAGTMTNPSPLLGTWTEIDGPGAARIEPCSKTPGRLCATGLARRAKGQPGQVETGLVLSDVTLDGPNRWRGTYHDGKRQLPATLRLMSPRVVEMKVCILMFCQTARYARAA
ncbi:MAG: DUF2147 domain-containing protein [Sphingomonas sp.]|uniref:hypothetical protein n=1 Tax=Sphingomonas sp. TaxID=28214 RepID=UPI0026002057|nr:hypothetical protein [Sphingomonas sp.]MBY0285187.1 DUF2147 domain-containing protein [Sphingomonas sp.]